MAHPDASERIEMVVMVVVLLLLKVVLLLLWSLFCHVVEGGWCSVVVVKVVWWPRWCGRCCIYSLEK